MDKVLQSDYNYILSYLPARIQCFLKNLNPDIIEKIQEIRLRANRPIVIVIGGFSYFLTHTSFLSEIYSSKCVTVIQNEITETVNKICEYSIHSHYEDLLNGYVTLKNGSRVGLTGTAVFENNKIKGIKDIDGLNIRVPRQVNNFSSVVFNHIYNKTVSNLLIVGPPSSGKTTMLKDLTYQLSSGKIGKFYKICVVDERKEIANSKRDISKLGLNTDVLYGYPKSFGISIAVRTLSPDIIICDEISSDDIYDIINAMNSGVIFIFTKSEAKRS